MFFEARFVASLRIAENNRPTCLIQTYKTCSRNALFSGRCHGCRKTFTFLPLFSLPYTHYSLLARCYAFRRRFVEHCSWEQATPTLKDSGRVPDPSTLRRWSNGVDRSQLVRSFLRQTLARIAYWRGRRDWCDDEAYFVRWLTPVLQILRPLRL
jgi:hypothetical protein